ncbi:sugar phosphate isomerase/epimerase [Azospirillum sp. TSO22-1]|uniref:sugar phosphate isomerase/epimerase family protein n=1 Tax=Azospirillum sp. TSO22-1 TaxID=716789 RepID=UPI000D61AF19|nr:sugar phosphate isomerase/epimerase [Azospirillum sp. TSO22-1]PWC42391.1 hypothetical protein TSO221_21705 [Azospirillum sp. TSO22-1]
MKPALCDIALPAADYRRLLPEVRTLGFLGLEVAPQRIAPDGPPTAAQVTAHRRTVEGAGLRVVGLNALLAGQPNLGIFTTGEALRRTRDHLVGLSAVCRDLGGRTLILGAGGRQRGALPLKDAWLACRAFLEDLLPRIEEHGTVLCFAPLGRSGGDFGTTATDCRILADALDHSSLGLQLNSAAQVENGDTGHVPFNASRGRLDQFCVCEPGLAVPEAEGAGRHADFRRHLASIAYAGWLTLRQRPTAHPEDGLRQGWALLKEVYLRSDSRTFMPPIRPTLHLQRIAAP